LSVRDGGLDLGSLELQRSEPLELLRRAWAQSLGHTLVGFKLNVGQSKQAFEAVLDEPDIAKILVSRRNRIRAFLSEQIAERTGVWESYSHSRKAGDPGPLKIDRFALEAHATRNADYLKGLNDRLSGSGQRAFHVAYEDIHLEKTHQGLLEFLGVDSTISLKGQTRQMNPGHLRDRIANYDELKNALRGSVFAADLETDDG
jgi:hypothetical protein